MKAASRADSSRTLWFTCETARARYDQTSKLGALVHAALALFCYSPSMGKAPGMTIGTDGVETVEQRAILRRHDCDEIQSYLFSKPVPPGGVADLLLPPRAESLPLQPQADGGPVSQTR